MPPVLKLPSEAELPTGPRRDLVIALHDIHKAAMRPSLRRLSTLIREEEELDGTASHETIRRMMRGETLPEWPQVQAVAVILTRLVDQRGRASDLPNLEEIAELWGAAAEDGTRPVGDSRVLLEELPPATSEDGESLVVPFGLEATPGTRGRQPALIDFSYFSHMLALGGARSGKSQLLRTIAGSAARDHSCADVHIYGIDCGNGALFCLEELPHCGAVVTRRQSDQAHRLMSRLTAELDRRQEAYDTERRHPGRRTRHPRILVLVDRADRVEASFSDAIVEGLDRLVREGDEVGLHVVATGNGALLQSKMSRLVDDRLAFRLTNQADYESLGVPAQRTWPMPPGSAIYSATGAEVAVALLDPDASAPAQESALFAIASRATERDREVKGEQRPFRIPPQPKRLAFEEAWRLRPTSDSALWTLLGLGGDELQAVGTDLAAGVPAFQVAGPAQSGKSTLLLTMARSLLATGVRLIVATPRPSPLRMLAGQPGVLNVFAGERLSEEEVRESLAQTANFPAVMMIDDAELLRDCDADPVLEELIQRRGGDNKALVLGGDAEDLGVGFRGFAVTARRARRGALLCPQSRSDGEIIGLRLPTNEVGQRVRPGRALVHLGDGRPTIVYLPTEPSAFPVVPGEGFPEAVPGPGMPMG